jgi:hypothetical protein
VPSAVVSSAASSEPSIDVTIINPRDKGVTVKTGTTGLIPLLGGRYRVAWLAPSCSHLTIAWVVHATRASTPISVVLPSGETFIELPAGVGSLDRVADCDATVRLEAASQ